MDFMPKYRDISIVSVAEVNKEFCSPFWLYDNKIISDDEMKTIVGQKVKIGERWVSFESKYFDLICDQQRLQVRSDNVEMSNRLAELTGDIVRSSMSAVNAVGINATYRIGFNTPVDFLRFCHHCVKTDGFTPLTPNGIMLDLTFRDWSEQETPETPVHLYNIKAINGENNQEKLLQITLNCHLQTDGDANKVGNYIKNSLQIHRLFFERCNDFIGKIQ